MEGKKRDRKEEVKLEENERPERWWNGKTKRTRGRMRKREKERQGEKEEKEKLAREREDRERGILDF